MRMRVEAKVRYRTSDDVCFDIDKSTWDSMTDDEQYEHIIDRSGLDSFADDVEVSTVDTYSDDED